MTTQPTSEMIEAVARSIALAEYGDQSGTAEAERIAYPSDYSPREIAILETQAKAAIAAMGEFTGTKEW